MRISPIQFLECYKLLIYWFIYGLWHLCILQDSGTDEPKAKRGRGRPKGGAAKKAKKVMGSSILENSVFHFDNIF